MEFVRNGWHPIAWATNVEQTPKLRVVLGKSFLLFRDAPRLAAPLEDLHPHRFAPLSLGRVLRDTIECGDRGLKFDDSERCITIQGQAKLSGSVPTELDGRLLSDRLSKTTLYTLHGNGI